MNNKRFQLSISWLIMLVAVYAVFKYGIIIALLIAALIYFFRDYGYEKKSAIEYFAHSKVFYACKIYTAITSFVAFIFVAYKILNSEHEQLISNEYAMIYVLFLIIFSPFILLALLHEVHLFRNYR